MNNPMRKDLSPYLIIVTVLGLTVMADAISIITLTIIGLLIQQFLVTLNSAATGGLAGSLALSYL